MGDHIEDYYRGGLSRWIVEVWTTARTSPVKRSI